MLEKSRYKNNEDIDRHNWRDKPIKLKYIPSNIKSPLFEKDLLNALDLNENEKPTIELLWGDIQLGKRIQACIIMWFSIYILQRPILYIFRNLKIDQTQLKDDIAKTDSSSFNVQFVKNIFEEFNTKLQTFFNEPNKTTYWTRFKLPNINYINNDDILNKLSSEEKLETDEENQNIFCCLMNITQLEKINNTFNQYIYNSHKLVNITLLVDESDLMCPTCSNDKTNINDEKDSTQCEKLLAKIYKKVIYVLHITGSAHSLLYNVTTRLNDNQSIELKISKVHKMKRSDDYFGLFNNNINFDTKTINTWWNNINSSTGKKNKYNIIEDYNINIRKIIYKILNRQNVKYNSFLISEEKTRVNQFDLANQIIKDFSNLFVIIYHGNCLRLYLAKEYEEELRKLSEINSQSNNTLSNVISCDVEKSENLPNNYCYFVLDTQHYNIKFVYKILRILFEHSKINISHKTVITITGKYGERGYSFTSDDYYKYSFHLTDQYFVSHASLNCTDILQRFRIQGKYPIDDFKDQQMILTIWTTDVVEDIMKNFYMGFIMEIEKRIMKCNGWNDIKDVLENIIDNGTLKFPLYKKYLDVRKKNKNIQEHKHYNSEINGFLLIDITNLTENTIKKWCQKNKLPEYNGVINNIKEIHIDECNFNKIKKPGIPIKINLPNIDNISTAKLTAQSKDTFVSEIFQYLPNIIKNKNLVNKRIVYEYNAKYEINKIKTRIKENKPKRPDKNCKNLNDYNLLIIKNDIPEFECKKGDCFITYYTNEYDTISEYNVHYNPYYNDYIFTTVNNKVIFSDLKEECKDNLNDDYYYWKTPDNILCLYMKDKPEIVSLTIIEPTNTAIEPTNTTIEPTNTAIEPTLNSNLLEFINSCCKKTENTRLRFGITDIYNIYKSWCINKHKSELLNPQNFKNEFEKFNFKIEKSKGVSIEGKRHKIGYNIMVELPI